MTSHILLNVVCDFSEAWNITRLVYVALKYLLEWRTRPQLCKLDQIEDHIFELEINAFEDTNNDESFVEFLILDAGDIKESQ